MSENQTMNREGWLLLAGLSLIWGSSFLFNEIALAELQPITVVTGRVAGAAITLLLIMKATGVRLPTGLNNWLTLVVLGFFANAAPFVLIVWGQTHISSGLASILNGTTPFFTIIIASVVVGERLTVPRVLGVLLGIIGVAVIFGASLAEEGFSGNPGELAVLGSSLCYGIALSLSRRFMSGKIKPMQAAFGQLVGASLIMLPLALFVDQAHTLPLPGLDVLGAVAMLAVVCGAAAYIIYFRMIDVAGATNTSLVTLTIPVVAVLLGILFLGEPLVPSHIYGMLLIGAGMMVMNGKYGKKATA